MSLGQLPALADDTVVVHGTAFPDARAAQLTLVGCESLYQRSTELLQPYISRGPGRPAMGTRSLKYDLAGGNAIGTLSYVDSMARTSAAGLQVYARPGAQGVAYAGYQSPDAEGYKLWIGRAPLSATGSWQQIDATTLSYTWAEYDMQTGAATGETADTATVTSFASDNGGDGAGFYMVGFGCDGVPFYMDAWRVGAPGTTTTYDLEALTSHLTMNGSTHTIDPGEEVTISGSARDGTGRRLVRGTMILEAKAVGTASFLPVRVVDSATTDPSVTLAPKESTIYRWRFADRPLATGSVSAEFRVDVTQPRRPEPETQTPQTPQAPQSSRAPDAPESSPTTTAPETTAPTTPSPSETPTPESTPEPSTTPSSTP
ncbi:MAG TPA: hypothetical protein VFO49_20355 [Nocardioides sp.]|nr:hypothetical protein [Nocardioides sp.]